MSKNILIVESDSSLSHSMRDSLTSRGFAVDETSDGKGTVETVRRSRPELVVLAVDLSAGQNGYIICSKLKKDDDLKAIPVVIIGKPDGFAAHRKMTKTRADDYLAKPFDASAIVDVVGALIGLPEPLPDSQEVVEDDSLSLSELLTDDDKAGEAPAEDLALEPATSEEVVAGDPDLDMLDSVFDEKNAQAAASDVELPVEEELQVDDSAPASDRTVVGAFPEEPPPPPPPSAPPRPTSPGGPGRSGDHAEVLNHRSKVTELTGALDEAKTRAEELETRVRELEGSLDTRNTELEAARAGAGGKSDKEVFALRDAANKKDKEILRLKNELNEKEKEILESHEKENSLEQQASESSGELARRDAQIKTLSAKADQLAGERKKIDQQLNASREEARSSAAQLSTLQTELEELQGRLGGIEGELQGLRDEKSELERSRALLDADLAEARGELETARSQLEERTREAEEARTNLETAQIDLDSAKGQLTSQATAFAEEAGSMRKRITDLEESVSKQGERIGRLQTRIRAAEELKSRVKQDLTNAISQLEESAGEDLDDLGEDEIAEA